jgi:hypothetical protein
MVWRVTYATVDDLHLEGRSYMAALSLNECLPEKNGEIWVTPKEMADRLVHGGVDPALEPIDITEALKQFNKGGRLSKRSWKHSNYYRPGNYDKGSPKDQRYEPPAILPGKNYLAKNKSSKGMIKELNKDIKRLGNIRNGIEKGEIKCE